MWYCDICEKEMNIITKSKHNISNSHRQRKGYGIVVKEDENIKPEIDEKEYIPRDVIEDCREKFFHTFEYRYMYDVIFTNMVNGEAFYCTNIFEFMSFKSEHYGLNKKVKKVKKKMGTGSMN